jgi:WD40 repeat protein
MPLNFRNILLILLGIIIIIGGGFAIYFFFFRAPVSEVVPEEEIEVPIAELPEAEVGVLPEEVEATPPTELEASPVAVGGLTQVETITPAAIVSNATLSGDGQGVNYYDAASGQFSKVLSDGSIQTLSDETFYDVENVAWAPDGNGAILEYPDGSNILYDFQTKKQMTLPKHWEDFDFSPQGDQIVAKSMGLDPDNRWLIVSDRDGSNAQAIEPLGNNADKVQVSWSPNNQVIATSRTGQPMGINRQQILLVGKNQENFPGLTVEGWGFDYEWSPTGDRMLYDVYNMDNNYNPTLWIVDAAGSNIGLNRRYLKVNTWSDKCAFADNTTLYCAVPDYLPKGAGLQPELADDIPDTIYKIDVTTGKKSTVGKPEDASTVKQLSISSDGKYLFYVDQLTNQLNQMRLK